MPDSRSLIPAVVLAAGLSTRMGRNKLLIEIRGMPVLRWTVDSLLAAGLEHIIIVTGHQAGEVQECCVDCGPAVHFVHNADFASGRASSIQAGLSALPADSDSVLIMPGDVPFAAPDLIRRLLAEFSASRRITFPLVNGCKGHPVIFPAASFELLQALQGDDTLHDYLLTHPGQTHPVQTDDPGCIRDLDRPQDLEQHG